MQYIQWIDGGLTSFFSTQIETGYLFIYRYRYGDGDWPRFLLYVTKAQVLRGFRLRWDGQPKEPLQFSCKNLISCLMYLFVEHAVPIICPEVFQHNLALSYGKGYGRCEDTNTDSKMTQCASDRKVHLKLDTCDSPYYQLEGLSFTHIVIYEHQPTSERSDLVTD